MNVRFDRWLAPVASLFLCSACSPESAEFPEPRSSALTQALGIQVVSVTAAPRTLPGGDLTVSVVAKNTGSTTWTKTDTRLNFTGDSAWTNATLTLSGSVKFNQQGTFSGKLHGPAQIGRWSLSWQPQNGATSFGAPIVAATEVSCSDGVFCNGDERYVNGKCVAGPPPCDDGEACTIDSCDEPSRRCGHTMSSGSCAVCAAKNCNPNCHGAVCGDDGCGGSCGPCGGGQACSGGACINATAPGTCANPLPITGTDANAVVAAGTYTVSSDNSDGYDETVPPCDPIPAQEKTFKFVVNQVMGADLQSFGIDTALAIYSDSCGGAVVGCNDDAAPPGNYGSHVWKMLQPGSYYVVVNGFDSHAVGPFTLQIRLVPGCVPQCDGKFCGDDGCGFSCGDCPTGMTCGSASKCVAVGECKPQCMGRQCGSDSCGGFCGNYGGACQEGKSCDEPTGACKNVAFCDHDRPVCPVACSSQEYCGSDCTCHRARDARPDLVIDEGRLRNEILFDTLDVSPSSCTVVEDCVGGTGLRRLLRFTVEATNQGNATLTVPPPKERPDLFQFSSCHGHYHFNGFASYALLDTAGNKILGGKKLAYCMEDTERVLSGPDVACGKKYDCTNQGIQAGWSDIYGNSLDCQWLDITGIASGNYQLSVTVNPNRAFEEGSFDNNTTTVPVTIP